MDFFVFDSDDDDSSMERYGIACGRYFCIGVWGRLEDSGRLRYAFVYSCHTKSYKRLARQRIRRSWETEDEVLYGNGNLVRSVDWKLRRVGSL